MDGYQNLPDLPLDPNGQVSRRFIELGIEGFHEACRFVHHLAYGYNSDPDEPLILFKERMGTCTTKHAAIAALAAECNLPVAKFLCIYPMTEALVTGARAILEKFGLPYMPMPHCFLMYKGFRVDLTEGNCNGKNGPIDEFLHIERVDADISKAEEYRRYRRALERLIASRSELNGFDLRRLLKARQEALALLKFNIGRCSVA